MIPASQEFETARRSRDHLSLDDAARFQKGPLLEASGPFEIRLAATATELKQAQRLRYAVFYEEGGAIAMPLLSDRRRDICPFDAVCDHLLVVDTRPTEAGKKPLLVGTYRLLRRSVAERHAGFYSQGEFNLEPLLARHPQMQFLELGRSCVHPAYRSKRAIELLWRGLWLYAKRHAIDGLMGCASLQGTDLDALRLPLSYLMTNCQADHCWQVAAWPHTAAKFTPLAAADIDRRRALAALPPLLKAYLRAGARCGINAVVDQQFGTTDVFTVLPMRDVEDRYLAYYGQPSCVSGALVT